MSYLPVRITTIKADIKLGFDLYVSLPHKYILYVLGDDSIEKERLNRLKEKKVRRLFIKDTDEEAYQDYLDRILSEHVFDENLTDAERAPLLTESSDEVVKEIYKDPNSEKSYRKAQTTSNTLVRLLDKNTGLLREIFNAEGHDDDEIEGKFRRHAINSASLCISFADVYDVSLEEKELLGMAGLFHDMGYTKMAPEDHQLFFKELDKMTAEELTKFKEHPRFGVDILQGKNYASPALLELILCHEERRNGNGYPRKLLKLTVHQEIVALCTLYDSLITYFKYSKEEAFKDIKLNQLGNFDLEMVKKFQAFIEKTHKT